MVTTMHISSSAYSHNVLVEAIKYLKSGNNNTLHVVICFCNAKANYSGKSHIDKRRALPCLSQHSSRITTEQN